MHIYHMISLFPRHCPWPLSYQGRLPQPRYPEGVQRVEHRERVERVECAQQWQEVGQYTPCGLVDVYSGKDKSKYHILQHVAFCTLRSLGVSENWAHPFQMVVFNHLRCKT